MRDEVSGFGGPGASLQVRYTDKPVSGWGGLVAVVRYMDRLGVREWLRQALADGRSSPNQIPVVDIAFPRGKVFSLLKHAAVKRRHLAVHLCQHWIGTDALFGW